MLKEKKFVLQAGFAIMRRCVNIFPLCVTLRERMFKEYTI